MSQAKTDINIEELLNKLAKQAEEIKQLKSKKKFGLVWEDKPDAQVLRVRDEAPMLCEDTSKAVVTDQNATNHILINGDNFHALTALRATHTGKVDVIYIDPPYNTGNKDFIYNDDYLDKEDGYRHSKWLSFIEKRLVLAKELMSDTGVIFVSIDDNEQARLKLLMDQVFGPQNFVANIIWQSKSGGAHDSKTIATTTEYSIVYSKNIASAFFNKEEDTNFGKYKGQDAHLETRGGFVLDKLDRRMQSSHFSAALKYPVECPDGSLLWPGGETEASEENWNWRWSKTKFEWGIANDFLVFKKNNKDKWTLHSKQYEKVNNEGKPTKRAYAYRNLILSNEYNSTAGNKEITNILGSHVFDYPKPSGIIKKFIRMASRKDSIVLDFFAGSGTSAQAVVELNNEDGGTRQCILVTDGGKAEIAGESSKNAKEATVNIAEEITYERVRRILTGKDWADGKERGELGGNLRYFKIEMEPVASDLTELDQRFSLEKYAIEHAKIAVNLFNEVLSKDEFDEETGMTVDYKVYSNKNENHYLVGVNCHDFTLSDLEEWFQNLPSEVTVVMVGNGLEEIDWVKMNADRITVDDVLGRVIRSRNYVASKLPLV